MGNDGSRKPEFDGCRLFVAPSGRSGFALGTQGNRWGGLFALFVSPGEQEGTADLLMRLAMQEGANHLITYADPILDHWFAQYGFKACALVPKEATPEGDADLLSMVWSGVGAPIEPGPLGNEAYSRKMHCGCCGSAIAQRVTVHEMVGGYVCGDCRFLSAYGMLTLPPRMPL
jgi:hypothetical protein